MKNTRQIPVLAKPELPTVAGYRLMRLVGAGGMGSVYEAEKLATHELFAVKFLHEHIAADASHLLRFEREVSALREIRHPNVVQVFEWSLPQAGGPVAKPHLVMELLTGETLDALLTRRKRLSPARAVTIMLQVLDGLAAAHAAGVIHRDMGPSNVFLEVLPGGRTRAKILDFGLARPILNESAVREATQPGTLLGKPAYAAPELFLEQPLTETADIFACGMILYRMLAGRLPYDSVTPQMLWVERFSDRRSSTEYPSPQQFAVSVPSRLAEIVCRSIRKRPEDRIRTAKEFQRLLLEVEPELTECAETSVVDAGTMRRPAPEAGTATEELSASDLDLHVQPGPAVHHTGAGAKGSDVLDLDVQVVPSSGTPVAAGSATAGPTTSSLQLAERRRRRRPWGIALGAVGAAAAGAALTFWVAGPAPGRDGGIARGGGPGTAPAPAGALTREFGEPQVAGGMEGSGAADQGGRSPATTTALPTPPVETPGVPDADLQGGETPLVAREAATAEPGRVRFTVRGLPAGAEVLFDDTLVDATVPVELAYSETPVRIVVRVPGDRYEPYVVRLAPTQDRIVEPVLRATRSGASRPGQGSNRDAGAAGDANRGLAPDAGGYVRSQGGLIFVTNYGGDAG